MHGYDTYDIVWRQYYPAIGRFQTPDPEIENDYDLSPYSMCDNNMVHKTDPDGRQAQIAFEAYDLYKFYKYTRYVAAVGTGVAAGAGTAVVYNHFVSGDRSKEVFQALMQAANTTTNNNKSKSNVKDKNSTASTTNYSNVPDPKNAGDGKKTTQSQRKKLLEENKKQNNGELKSDGDGRKLDSPSKNVKGQKANMNQAEVDHINPRSKGGSNKNTNLRVISKEENLTKGNR